MSSYTLTGDEYNALTFGLDHHIPARTIKNITDIELRSTFKVLIVM